MGVAAPLADAVDREPGRHDRVIAVAATGGARRTAHARQAAVRRPRPTGRRPARRGRRRSRARTRAGRRPTASLRASVTASNVVCVAADRGTSRRSRVDRVEGGRHDLVAGGSQRCAPAGDVVAEPIGHAERGVALDRPRVPVDPADQPVRLQGRTSAEVAPLEIRRRARSRDHQDPMNPINRSASSGPRSSWRKWPPPSIVTCGCPCAPGTFARNGASPPFVTGSLSLKHSRNGLSNVDSTSHAATLSGAGRVVGAGRHERREDARPGLVAVVGERRVVAGDHLGRQVGGGAAVDRGIRCRTPVTPVRTSARP